MFVSVSFRSYLFSNVYKLESNNIKETIKFPSPFGVICSLMIGQEFELLKNSEKFPSPFGVICSLIKRN